MRQAYILKARKYLPLYQCKIPHLQVRLKEKKMENKNEKIKNKVVNKQNIEANAEKVLLAGGEMLISSLYKKSLEDAERVKTLLILYTATFILFALLMVALATSLFLFPTEGIIWRDGSTLWGVVAFKIVIFIPLLLVTWFFGSEAKRIRILYEMIMLKAFIMKFAEDILVSSDRKEFVKEFLLDMALNIVKAHK